MGVELGTNGKSDSVCGPKMWADIQPKEDALCLTKTNKRQQSR